MKEYREEDFLLLSGIQHFAFCKRQWALIHLEQQWYENEHTVEGDIVHKRAHDAQSFEKRNQVIISRGIPVYSRTMGINGICDIVEFIEADSGIILQGYDKQYQIYPVEYKKGSPKDTEIDILQLTAQAMCLEEMMGANISEGALYYAEIRRREVIAFSDALRQTVRKTFEEMHQIYQKGTTPKAKMTKSCNACSLKDVCLPRLEKTMSVKEYLQKAREERYL